MTDEQGDIYAGQAAEAALDASGDPAEAAALLFQAGTAVLVAHFPTGTVLALLDALGRDAIHGVRDLFGVGETTQ